MLERGLVSEESNPYQYRFVDIVDPDDGKVLFELEHEVRCVTHPMYRRPLMNRNPAQRQATYVSGLDARSFWTVIGGGRRYPSPPSADQIR